MNTLKEALKDCPEDLAVGSDNEVYVYRETEKHSKSNPVFCAGERYNGTQETYPSCEYVARMVKEPLSAPCNMCACLAISTKNFHTAGLS